MITILKLSSGYEIAGMLEYENNDIVVLNKPLQINYRYFVSPSPAISFVRFIMFGEDQNVTFPRSHIIAKVKAREAFTNVYEHHAEYYYTEHQKIIDSELELHKKMTEDEETKNFLASLSFEGSAVN
jgi:hypothetical protein